MLFPAKFRRILSTTVAALVLSGGAADVYARIPPERRPAEVVRQSEAPPRPNVGPKHNQEHLAQWMDRHSNLSLADQQRALGNEPGFRDLPQQTQQRMRDRLTQLNNMTPEKRRRILDRTEAMERLTLPERQQVRGAMQQLGSLPEDRRRMVARAFRDLREMPQPQRDGILNSDRFREQFSGEERNTLSNLLAVEPYLPVAHRDEGPAYGK